ncbi:MAG TPA: aminotransferase, partial [Candidatus Dormibacteraeota bacterium]|nr:aminotransferase [Candidatus Dormibacteraeota bacterium]
NLVVALLNDLFGIQARGGCSCAGPYGHRLLGIDLDTSHEFEREIARGCEGIKPGWVRVNLNYFISDAVFEYILDAVDLVASEGWRLLPQYAFDPRTGLWRHRAGQVEAPLSLDDVSYAGGAMRYRAHRHREPESRLAAYLEEAREILRRPPMAPPPAPALDVGPDFERLRWFLLPHEVLA